MTKSSGFIRPLQAHLTLREMSRSCNAWKHRTKGNPGGRPCGRESYSQPWEYSRSIIVAAAQETYPSRSITLTIGFAAGGNGDIITRIVAEGLSPGSGSR